MSQQTVHDYLRDLSFSVDSKLIGRSLNSTIKGELDLLTGGFLEKALGAYDGQYHTVTYDLSGLTFIDCAGLAALLAPVDGEVNSITITRPSRAVRTLLELLQLQSMIADERGARPAEVGPALA